MRKLIGYNVEIHLKDENDPLSGLLVSVDDAELYVQESAESGKVFVVPRTNISYCVTDSVPNASRVIEPHHRPQQYTPEMPQPQQHIVAGVGLRVIIGEDIVEEIPTPPTFNINEWHEDILRVVMGNPAVKMALLGKVQKSIEYYPPQNDGEWGAVVFDVAIDEEAPVQRVPQKPATGGGGGEDGQSSFTMSVGNSPVATEYLSPSQMATRLNSLGRGGNKNEG